MKKSCVATGMLMEMCMCACYMCMNLCATNFDRISISEGKIYAA